MKLWYSSCRSSWSEYRGGVIRQPRFCNQSVISLQCFPLYASAFFRVCSFHGHLWWYANFNIWKCPCNAALEHVASSHGMSYWHRANCSKSKCPCNAAVAQTKRRPRIHLTSTRVLSTLDRFLTTIVRKPKNKYWYVSCKYSSNSILWLVAAIWCNVMI